MGEERRKILQMVSEGKITVEEADELLTALAAKAGPSSGEGAVEAKAAPRYLRVLVDEERGDKVNIRVPLGLIRAGLRLGSLIPKQAKEKVDCALKDKGIDLGLSKADPKNVEELIEALSHLTVEVNAENESKGDRVRIFCE